MLAKDRNPIACDGVPDPQIVFRRNPLEKGVLRTQVHSMQLNDVSQKGQIQLDLLIGRRNHRRASDGKVEHFIKGLQDFALASHFVHTL